MDATQTIILTTIFNLVISGLVGGIVIYTLQKKIDATIQKSLFEHQTKFARNYPKAMEGLEAFYKKYLKFAEDFKLIILEVQLSLFSSSILDADFKKDLSELKERTLALDMASEFSEDLNDLRLFLPVYVISGIERILSASHFMGLLLLDAIHCYELGEVTDAMINSSNAAIKLADLDVTAITSEKAEISRLFYELGKEMDKQRAKLEALYKSMAEAI